MSADLPDETDAIDDLAHALADYFRRKVVVVGTNDRRSSCGASRGAKVGQLKAAAVLGDGFRYRCCRGRPDDAFV